MKQLKMLKIVNTILAIDFMVVVISVLLYKIKPGELNGSEEMASLHGLSGMIFFIFVILHIILNFKWIKANFFSKKKG